MPRIHISEHSSSGGQDVAMPPLAEYTLEFGSEPVCSAPFGDGTRILIVHTDVPCRIAISKEPKPSDDSKPLAADKEFRCTVTPGDRLAAVRAEQGMTGGMEGFFAVIGNPKKAQQEYERIDAAQKKLDATLGEVRSLAARAAADKASADIARGEAESMKQNLQIRMDKLDDREKTVVVDEGALKRRKAEFAEDEKRRHARLTDRELAIAAREAEVARLHEQATADAAAAEALKADLQARVEAAKKLVASV